MNTSLKVCGVACVDGNSSSYDTQAGDRPSNYRSIGLVKKVGMLFTSIIWLEYCRKAMRDLENVGTIWTICSSS